MSWVSWLLWFLIYVYYWNHKTLYSCVCSAHQRTWALAANVHSLCFLHNYKIALSKQLSRDRETSFNTSPPAHKIKVTGTCQGLSEQDNCHSNSMRCDSPLKDSKSRTGHRAVNLIGAHETGSRMPLISQTEASDPLGNGAACYQSFSLSCLYWAPFNCLEKLFFTLQRRRCNNELLHFRGNVHRVTVCHCL